jgi:hypothetical protein
MGNAIRTFWQDVKITSTFWAMKHRRPDGKVRSLDGPTRLYIREVSAYHFDMKSDPALERLLQPLSDCLTGEGARRLLSLKPDRRLQARVDKLSEKATSGTLTPKEREEYGKYVSFGTIIAILKSKGRISLARSPDAE